MKFTVHVHIHNHNSESKLDEILTLLINTNLKLNKLMTKQEFADAVNAASDQLQKALNEITTAIQNSGNSSPEMDAALTRLQTAATALDDLNPDAPAPPVPPVDPNA